MLCVSTQACGYILWSNGSDVLVRCFCEDIVVYYVDNNKSSGSGEDEYKWEGNLFHLHSAIFLSHYFKYVTIQ